MSGTRSPGPQAAGSSPFDFWAHNLERAGGFAPGTPGVHEGRAGSPGAGAEVEFALCLEAGRILRVRYRFRGSPWTNAACAFYAQALEGQPATFPWPSGAEVARQLGYPRTRYDEALIVEDALMAALAPLREVSDD